MGPTSTQDAPRPRGTSPRTRPTNPPPMEACVQEAFLQGALRAVSRAYLRDRSSISERAGQPWWRRGARCKRGSKARAADRIVPASAGGISSPRWSRQPLSLSALQREVGKGSMTVAVRGRAPMECAGEMAVGFGEQVAAAEAAAVVWMETIAVTETRPQLPVSITKPELQRPAGQSSNASANRCLPHCHPVARQYTRPLRCPLPTEHRVDAAESSETEEDTRLLPSGANAAQAKQAPDTIPLRIISAASKDEREMHCGRISRVSFQSSAIFLAK
ncbi:hypothetical protein F558DRAFT_03484 [Streptomyces sp. AmelKG-A3]|nr:hypothetical protein GA0115247_127658 [Streptomyces sp. PalvLS-984]SDD16661.1 hypothetical protein F558DRAFT_03484 [Streptomyces sp. AmelKG-A3]